MTVLGQTRRPDVTFHANGRIDITARATRMLGLTDGDVIDIATIGGEHVIYIKHHAANLVGRHEAVCHSTKEHSRNMRCYSARLCHYVLNRHTGKEVVRLPVGAPMNNTIFGTALPIIIHHSLNPKPHEV